jgi:hypothetical protein
MWDSTNIGTVILDPDFDLSSEEAQKSFLDLCQNLPG